MSGKKLRDAAATGDLAAVKNELEAGVDVDSQSGSGWSALHGASVRGRYDVVKLLLEKGANVNVKTKDIGWTSLQEASFHGHVDVVKLLLESGADVTIKSDSGSTALDYAKTEDIKALLRAPPPPRHRRRSSSASKGKKRSSSSSRKRSSAPSPPAAPSSSSSSPSKRRSSSRASNQAPQPPPVSDAVLARLTALEERVTNLDATVGALSSRMNDHGQSLAVIRDNLTAQRRVQLELEKDRHSDLKKALTLLHEQGNDIKISRAFHEELDSRVSTEVSNLEQALGRKKDIDPSFETLKSLGVSAKSDEGMLFTRFVGLMEGGVRTLIDVRNGYQPDGTWSQAKRESKASPGTSWFKTVGKYVGMAGKEVGGLSGFIISGLGMGFKTLGEYFNAIDGVEWKKSLDALEGHVGSDGEDGGLRMYRAIGVKLVELKLQGSDVMPGSIVFWARRVADECLKALMMVENATAQSGEEVMEGVLHRMFSSGMMHLDEEAQRMKEKVVETYGGKGKKKAAHGADVKSNFVTGTIGDRGHIVQQLRTDLEALSGKVGDLERKVNTGI